MTVSIVKGTKQIRSEEINSPEIYSKSNSLKSDKTRQIQHNKYAKLLTINLRIDIIIFFNIKVYLFFVYNFLVGQWGRGKKYF